MAPKALSLAEIRQFMLNNGCKVTNHALVKYFKPFLTQPATQTEARKQFKTYVNILATIKNENNQKYLVLRKKYLHECPTEDMVKDSLVDESVPCSPGGLSLNLDAPSPYRAPPPYKPPPQVAIVSPTNKTIPSAAQPSATGLVVDQEHADTYGECVNEFAAAVRRIDNRRTEESEPKGQSISRLNSLEEQNKENVPRFSFSSGTSNASSITVTSESSETTDVTLTNNKEQDITDNPISVKEATRIFNRMFSEEEAKILSPSAKKKPEKQLIEEKELPEVTLAHPKAKEWIVAMAKASYQELAKLANEHPELVKLQDPATGYTAIHWAAKHGNEDVVKLIAGTYKADVNARTNGGYTPLHLAMQFGRVNIFELLCNVYKANRDLMDWSGNKPLDYSKQRTTVSALTYSKIKARRKNTVEKDLGFLRIGSLNVRVKKTTEAFSNFLGVGNGNGNIIPTSNPPHRHHHHAHHRHRAGMTNPRTHHHHYRFTAATAKAEHLSMKSQKGMNNQRLGTRASVPINTNNLEKFHKSWTSADNLPITNNTVNTEMPPPKVSGVKKRQKSIISMPSSTHTRCSMGSNTTDSPRDSISSSNSSSNLHSGYSSMPTTPNQLRAPIGLSVNIHGDDDTDSDSACGFGSNWSVGGRNSLSNGNIMQKPKFS